MPKIIGGTFESEQEEPVNLLFQGQQIAGLVPDAALGVYGPSQILKSPRANGTMVPLWMLAQCLAPLANLTLRIRPTYTDGTVGAGLLWTPFTAAFQYFEAGFWGNSLGSIPEATPAATEAVEHNFAAEQALLGLVGWMLGIVQLEFDCQSSGNNDTANFLVSYVGIYT
jgi:hypothetical protein